MGNLMAVFTFPVPAHGTRLDPSGTVTLRRAMCRHTGVWFDTLTGLLRTEVGPNGLVGNAVWAGLSDPQKAAQFNQWLKQQVEGTITGQTQRQLWDRYLLSAAKGGLAKVSAQVTKGKPVPVGFQAGQTAAMSASKKHVDNTRLLADKAWTDLQGVTADMVARLSRVLTEGLIKKSAPKTVAAEMAKQTGLSKQRALLIARTEIIRMHAEAQLDGLEALGVYEVTPRVEWLVTSKGACERCGPMGGKTFTTAQARGKIPVHPNCRCCWAPVGKKGKY